MVLFTHTAFDADSAGERQLLSLVQTSAFQILFILVLIQGFSFIFYYCHEKHLKSGTHFAVVLTILFPPIGVIVRIIGLLT